MIQPSTQETKNWWNYDGIQTVSISDNHELVYKSIEQPPSPETILDGQLYACDKSRYDAVMATDPMLLLHMRVWQAGFIDQMR